jgi:hypothetical protein
MDDVNDTALKTHVLIFLNEEKCTEHSKTHEGTIEL